MKHEPNGPVLAAVFVDYDNIYLSLRRKNEEAAKRFSKDAGFWIKELTNGSLVTPTNGTIARQNRRLVMARCYGNPVPRRNTSDNSTDMNSFPFVRHHFLRGGFEVIDCPPLTAQLKNSADIRMVMDMRDLLNHDAYYDEFIILSSDADFTPMLHRLRAHARHTVIYANDYTAAPYTAICDGEVRESDLLKLLMEGKVIGATDEPVRIKESPSVSAERIRAEIITAVVTAVRTADAPVPLEALAERTTRALGHDQTVGTSWAGAGSFLELLRNHLPDDVQLTDQPPYLAYDGKRAIEYQRPAAVSQARPAERSLAREPIGVSDEEVERVPRPARADRISSGGDDRQTLATPSVVMEKPTVAARRPAASRVEPESMQATAPAVDARSETLQRSISRIHDASQVPALSPSDYRKLFVVMAQEITENNLQGAQTITNIMTRAADRNVEVRRDDVRFILEVVSEADPWFDQGASANLFAGRFHNFVVARCRSQGVELSAEDLDLIEAWFAGNGEPLVPPRAQAVRPVSSGETRSNSSGRHASVANSKPLAAEEDDEYGKDDFPRILQSRRRF